MCWLGRCMGDLGKCVYMYELYTPQEEVGVRRIQRQLPLPFLGTRF